jgi:hypothetical protein
MAAHRVPLKLLEPIGLAGFCARKNAVLFAGNEKITEEIKALVGSFAPSLHVSPNVRPSLETEDLEPAQRELARMVVNIRKRQIKGVDLLDLWSGGIYCQPLMPPGAWCVFLRRCMARAREF